MQVLDEIHLNPWMQCFLSQILRFQNLNLSAERENVFLFVPRAKMNGNVGFHA